METERFALSSDPWVNLHHFLFEWARNVPARQPEDRRRPVEVPEQARMAELDAGERQAWNRALALYRERWIARRLVVDEELIDVRDALASIACTGAGPERLPAEAWEVLSAAMPVYRRHWWPRHDARNRQLLGEIAAGLKRHERPLTKRLAEVYGGHWPAEPVRADVSAYAGWTGAYTTNDPDHVTITSTTNPSITGLNALEMLLHEVSHASFLEEPFLADLEAAFRARGAKVSEGLSHDLQWITPAILLRSRLRGEELRGFQTYAERSGLYARSRITAGQRLQIEKHWLPFLAGRGSRTEALDAIAAELVPPRQAVRNSRGIER